MPAVAKNALPSTSSKSKTPSMLLKFKRKDSPLGVQKATVKQMANLLGFNETDVVHYALSKLAREIIPAYELDDGALSESEINKIRKLSGVDQGMLMTSALFA
ncbi:MAG: hypothetical protein RL667_976 [Pseudomonadota bacterium]|jgi:hypothetical protein